MATYLPGAISKELPESEAKFVGMYVQRDVDSQAQLFLLDDYTFCFTFMGGSLDLIKAGRWKSEKNESAIHIQEERADTPIHPAFAQTLDRLEKGMVGINFDGYTLSNAYSPVFAISSSDTVPEKLRPLFSDENSSWSQTYALPLIEADKAKYIFIGDREVDAYGKPQQRIRVTLYKLGKFDAIRIGYNNIQAEPPMSAIATMQNNILHMDRSKFGSKRPLSPDMIKEVREQCINPVLYPNKNTLARELHRDDVHNNGEVLTPLKTFYLDASAISGEPLFANKDESDTAATDSIEALIDSEKMQLDAALQNAMDHSEKLDDFFLLGKKISEKNNRLKKQLPGIVTNYAKLLVSITAKGDFKTSEKIFINFMENIYPVTLNVKNEVMSYSLSVIASQGLIITTPLKNAEISGMVFEKLLGQGFDITTHKNSALIYNLACYYAVNNQKQEMLIATKQARKRGTPIKQFLSDADFKSYWSDDNFLKTLNEN